MDQLTYRFQLEKFRACKLRYLANGIVITVLAHKMCINNHASASLI